ncbi:recombinase zinc beta ribbon domain-containing protein [Saccharopolyspora kobensis]|uniref:recombinase zinc beta ribbon domain-containing protein n=1 Tax=Saccharopolyspora kobensis TaxID=146035 RepID=UPI0015A60A9A|nr:recombinase zinc beta ribbon domain-containing protein [Saccharopolyspora kobensis]
MNTDRGSLVRFTFYGRMSTTEYQDRVTSRGWQLDVAEETIAEHGTIVAEYFDQGCSRRWSWTKRPRAAALLAAAQRPDRGFDAVVIGEYERAFYGDQFQTVLAALADVGVQVWLPEAGGPVDLENPAHQALMLLLGSQSRQEVLRARHRVLAAMRTQVRTQGRFLGGRPPYGYRLVDAGPHPNPVHARWGRRLHRLEPDPGHSRVGGVDLPAARHRTQHRRHRTRRTQPARSAEYRARPVPTPDATRTARGRNGSRAQSEKSWKTHATPGGQVWNRHTTSRSHRTARRAGGTGGQVNERDWAVSKAPAHPALVDEATFQAVQGMRAARKSQDGDTRTYLLAGLIMCGVCDRRFDSHWVHNRPGYRCRHGHTSARTHTPIPKSTYVREDHLLDGLRVQLNEATGDNTSLANYLRTNSLVIVYRDPDWTIEKAQGRPVAGHSPSRAC